jgi:predicted Ser/Thr protein kinase
MSRCTACGAEMPIASRFCPNCGAAVGSDDATLTALDGGVAAPRRDGAEPRHHTGSDSRTPNPNPKIATDDVATLEFASAKSPISGGSARATSSSSRPPSSAAFSLSEGRFLPGRLLAGRYRIIALLGRGGMGEVYRADDLTLGQAVALKFLSEEASRDEGLLERFRNEVRIARRVSHPNVCRVYDVGEVDGHTFFTMEYVDGEDLASLLRRIGRLPQDKALDIARQLCSGIAAAHAKGVLHRDLKPANIMLDGRGQVVVTDFGLAGLNEQIHGADIRSGTPAYMAPEQLAGKEVTAQSDLYSLGLVLYEVFTGKRAFTAEALTALVRGGEASAPSRPSSVVKDLDPAIERVILRCLEPEPRLRPASALSVVGALPGGDPLAAALAAGETPSPEMVAAAGETSGLAPRFAIACLAAILIGLAVSVYFAIRDSGTERMGLELSPEVLQQKAREMIVRFGYEGRPADSFSDFDLDLDFTNYVEKHETPRPQWDRILRTRPSVLKFLYRQSPDNMLAKGFHDFLLTPGIVDWSDPPPILSGMIRMQLDPQGRLIMFEAIPAEVVGASQASAGSAGTASTTVVLAMVPPFDWNRLFSAADLDPAQFQPAQPKWNSLASSDTRAAWTGKWPGTDLPLRVEAAAFQGKPVFFRLIGDWIQPPRMQPPPDSAGKKAANVLLILALTAMIVCAVWLARRNYRQGRGDMQGALLLARITFVLLMVLWLLQSHLVPDFPLFGQMMIALATSLFMSTLIFVLYLALEPYVRRYWPHAIISWSRLLTGRLRDPLAGRDILFGVLLGVIWLMIFKVGRIVTMRMGDAPELLANGYLLSTRAGIAVWLSQLPLTILATLQFFFIFLGLKVLLKRDWLATIVFITIFSAAKSVGENHIAATLAIVVPVYLILSLIVYRFGLVPLACAIFTVDMLANVPFTANISTWYFGTTMFSLCSVIALAAWGFYYSLDPGRRIGAS